MPHILSEENSEPTPANAKILAAKLAMEQFQIAKKRERLQKLRLRVLWAVSLLTAFGVAAALLWLVVQATPEPAFDLQYFHQRRPQAAKKRAARFR